MPTMSPMQKRFMAKGAIEMRREDILDVLNLRFGSVPTDLAEVVQKIEDGTYGLSDASGAPIPTERLEAAPEALYTLAEQQSRDAAR